MRLNFTLTVLAVAGVLCLAGCEREGVPTPPEVLVLAEDQSISSPQLHETYVATIKQAIDDAPPGTVIWSFPITRNTVATVGEAQPITLPLDPFNTNPIVYKEARNAKVSEAIAQATALLSPPASRPTKGANSDILGAFGPAAVFLNGAQFHSVKDRRLLILSDMVDQAPGCDFLAQSITPGFRQALIREQTKNGPAPDLTGVKVWAAGVGGSPTGPVSAEKFAEIENFWIAYIKAMHGDISTDRYGGSLMNYAMTTAPSGSATHSTTLCYLQCRLPHREARQNERSGLDVFRQFFTRSLMRLDQRMAAARTAKNQGTDDQPKIPPQSVVGYELDENGGVLENKPLILNPRDRMKHAMTFGQPGSGKSVLLRRLALATVGSKDENTFIQDPRGSDVTETLLRHLVGIAPPEHWVGRVGLIDLAADRLPSCNPLYVADGADPYLVASDFTGPVIEMADPGVRWEELFRNTVQALCLSEVQACPADIQIFLSNREFRRQVLSSVRDPFVRSYFASTYDTLSDPDRAQWASSVNNKVSPMLSTPVLRRLYRADKPFDFGPFLDQPPGKLLLLSLRLGSVPEQAALLASRTILRQVLSVAFAREAIAEEKRRPTHLLLDEISHLVGDAQWERALVETRKYATGITGAGQSITQIPSMERRRTLIGSVQFLFVGRTGAQDAAEMVRETGTDDIAAMKKRLMSLAPGQMLVIERGKDAKFVQIVKDAEPTVDQGAVDALRQIALNTMNARPVAEIDREIEARYLSGNAAEPEPEVRPSPANRSHRRTGGSDATA